jgi:hypothetical protein
MAAERLTRSGPRDAGDGAPRFREVPDQLADTIIDALRATTIKGRKATVRRERPR